MTMEDAETIRAAAERARHLLGTEDFDVAVVLGSGLGGLAERVDDAVSVPYRELSCFPPVGVAGHSGHLLAGRCEGRRTLFFQGRYHLYEGYTARQVTLPVRFSRALGCSRLLLTNAVGGIREGFRAGDFMFIADHINLMGDNPLRGIRSNPFVDLTSLYRKDLFSSLAANAAERDIRLHQGVLAALPGPSYETPAEIRALRSLGADAVSMSTVPEAIMGKYLGMEVAGLSLVANAAAGISASPLSHEEVLAAGRRGETQLWSLICRLISLWPLREGLRENPTDAPSSF
jgi:purine-nucleoside phosphorylase